eukprot:CAMPEP_0202962756 /NCGR_PEP_ID=MMETSP1396-20130829/6821_1 /ASSEMBLY_ACC=CAM_ASM_000872 /TAXON_ID= /ORGANISM="Pseudokeronopsis sp., Strain Brazil" /LENGTH=32 /DNA_ID= /DNA_START= /DNA_END= /DNA_ORIENTATION=
MKEHLSKSYQDQKQKLQAQQEKLKRRVSSSNQ